MVVSCATVIVEISNRIIKVIEKMRFINSWLVNQLLKLYYLIKHQNNRLYFNILKTEKSLKNNTYQGLEIKYIIVNLQTLFERGMFNPLIVFDRQ